MLFCDMVVAVCICEVVESDFCLSSGFGVLVMCSANLPVLSVKKNSGKSLGSMWFFQCKYHEIITNV